MYARRYKTQQNDEMCMCSRVLSRALHKLGANQMMRQRYYERCMLESIGYMSLYLTENGTIEHHESNIQTVGSQFEGTRTVGMRSDIDSIRILTNEVVEENKARTYKINKQIVVVIADMFTPPGFVKLKVHEKGWYMDFHPVHVNDKKGNCFLSNLYTDRAKLLYSVGMSEKMMNFERHGPALSTKYVFGDTNEPSDAVTAYHCKSILSFTQNFFTRSRRFSWPSMSTLNIMKDQGCLLVPIGHSECNENQRNLQWRVSFSFQERHLMFNLNSAQFLCYILLKLVKTSHISPYVELTSYHCKTALFYTMENTANEIWKEENLLHCFILCLNRLKRWSKKHFCPNYFLPELNLFTGKIKEKNMYKLIDILSNVIDSPRYYLGLIVIGNFGKLIQLYELNSSKVRNIEFEIDKEVSRQLQKLLYHASKQLITIKNVILQKMLFDCSNINEIINYHYKWLKCLKEINSVAGIPLDGVTWALPHVSRFLHSSLGSHLGIKASDTANVILQSWYTVTTAYHLWMGLNSDSMSGKMKLATMLLFTGNLNSNTLVWLCNANIMIHKVCMCKYTEIFAKVTTQFEFSRARILQLNASQFLEKYVSTCTVFLPSESKLMLYPLQFEMFRSLGLSFFQFVTLDSNVYYILLSMYSSRKQEQKQLVEKLFECSSSDMYKHRETTLNILGWLASAEEPK